jgi:hypothetical protein
LIWTIPPKASLLQTAPLISMWLFIPATWLPKFANRKVLEEVTWTKDGCSKNLTRTRNVPPKCNKQVTSKQQTRSFLTSIN